MKKTIFILLILSLTLTFSSCEKRYSEKYWGLFDTVAHVEGYFKSEEEFNSVKNEVYSILLFYNELLDAYEDSDTVNLKKVNESGGVPCEISPELFDFLEYLKEVDKKTNGACNGALGSVTLLWKEAINTQTLPDDEKLKEASRHTDFDTVILDEKSMTVTLTDPNLRIDAGAVAKGYVSKILTEHFKDSDLNGLLINLGGNVVCIGEKKGEKWNVGIRSPFVDGNIYSTVLLSDESLVTSGSYERGAYIEGEYYHHIIDPETLYPSKKHLSVTVRSDDPCVCDVLSTALFVVDIETGEKMLENFENVEVLWIDKNGNGTHTEKFYK